LASTLNTIAAAVCGALAAYIEANSAAFAQDIATGETDLTALVANLIKDIPPIKGVAGLVAGPILAAIESLIESTVATEITKFPPATLVTDIVAFLQAEQKRLSA
jgi:hypothetical protein